MRILDAIACYLKDNGGPLRAAGKVLRLTWHVARNSGMSGLIAATLVTMRTRATQADQVRRARIMGRIRGNRKITILCTPHTLYVSHLLTCYLQSEGFIVATLTSPPLLGFGDEVHIVICPQMFPRLPKAMVAFQMEQSISDRWFTKRYLRILSNALAILDYSKVNVAYLIERGIPYQNIYYLPVRVIPDYITYLRTQGIELSPCTEKKYEVLFYGDPNCERRRKILDELDKHFQLEIVSDLFGAPLYEKIRSAKVVINLHYYEDALLETTRICECLSLGVPVVSERSANQDEYPDLAQSIWLVDAGNIPGMIEAINKALLWAPRSIVPSFTATNPYYLLRFLAAFGLTEFNKLKGLPSPPSFSTGKICLSLPETPARRAAFLSRRMDQFEIFDGLRHAYGWIGCALSYKFLATQAKLKELDRLTICEDDALLDDEAIATLPIIESYLDSLADNWDIFAGLIAHLNDNVQIIKVETYCGLTFVHIDRMTSMVFNIYNHTAFDVLAAWDETDVSPTNTIDRYLERQYKLQIVTTLPFLASHAEQETSTLWGCENTEYSEMIRASQALLEEKVQCFLAARPVVTNGSGTA
jgi:hypothetical protein